MRLALKSTLSVLVIYLVVVCAVAWWLTAQLNGLATSMAENTAQLVGGEVARALTNSALDQLQRADDTTRARLEQIVDGVTQHSGIVTSLAVVDRNGTVIAGDNVEVGRQLALPDLIFTDGPRVRLVGPSGALQAGAFFLMVPLVQDGAIAGYVRLEMRSERITHLYGRARRTLLFVALVGLVAVGAAGVLLHLQLSRRSDTLTRALERAVRGDGTPLAERRDEFARALDVARRVGRELSEARGGRQQAQHRMDALLRALDVGILMLEPDCALGFANGRAADLLGYRDPIDLARGWQDELQPALRAIVGQRAGDAAGRRAEHELPARGRVPRLTLEFYELGEGSCEGYLVLVRSSESIEALQNELGLAIQMRGLTRFYAAFAHDLKAPLNAMVMTLELLKISVQGATADTAVRDKQIAYIGTLNEEIRRLDRQLRTLLTHTAPPSEERRPVDLRLLLQELDALLAPQARRQRVALSTQLPEAPLLVNGFGDRLKQAMLNIVINALEAMPDGGELTIALEPDDGMARIAVRDTGPGIPPELLGSIYQMHFTTKTGGTGVGLYVARSVVEAHGGSLGVRSAPGSGTSFVLTLPVA